MARVNRNGNQKKEDRALQWTNVAGRMRLYGNCFGRKDGKGDYMSYSTSIGRKKDNGEYDNEYLKVFFPKGDDPGIEGLFEIDVKKGFLTLNCYDRGKSATHVVEIAVMVQEYDIRDEEMESAEDK